MSLEFIARNGIISRGNIIVTGSLTTSGSLALTNIGSSVFSGSITQIASTASFGGVVGIGTTTPARTLEVFKSGLVDGSVEGVRITVNHSSATAQAALEFYHQAGPSPNSRIATDIGNGGLFPSMYFFHNGSNRITITSGGNVLIGTSTNSARLAVQGSGATSSTTALLVQNSNLSSSLQVKDDGSVIASNYLQFASDGAGGNYLNFYRSSANSWIMGSAGIGNVLSISGNSIILQQDTIIQRAGLTVSPTITSPSPLTVNHTWNDASTVFATLDINVTNTLSQTGSKLIDVSMANTSSFVLDRNFNLGIKTSNPSASLHILGQTSSSLSSSLLVQNSSGTELLKVTDNGSTTLYGLGINSTVAVGSVNMNLAGGCIISTPTSLQVRSGITDTAVFFVNGNNATPFSYFTGNTAIGSTTDLNARLGIKGSGTTSSTTTLLIQNSAATNLFELTDNGQINMAASAGRIKFINPSSGASGNGIFWGVSATGTTYGSITLSSGGGQLDYDTNTSYFHRFLTLGGTEVMRIGTGYTANIGIRTTTPQAGLHIAINTIISGSAGTSTLSIGTISSGSALSVYKSGSTVVDIQGSSGQLFSVTDSLTGSLFSVNTVAGLPVMEAFSDNTVNIGKFNTYPIKVVATGSLANITGSFSGSLVGSVTGTTTTASFALTASYVNPLVQNVLVTGSLIVSGSSTFTNIGPAVFSGSITSTNYMQPQYIASSASVVVMKNIGGPNYVTDLSTGGAGDLRFYYGGGGGWSYNWYTDNTHRVRISDTGMGIGVGNIEPSARLHVKGSGATSSTTALLVQNANASPSLAVLDNGRVGIGTTTPTASLEVVDNSATTTTPLRVKNGSSSGTAGIAIVGGPIGNQASSVLIQGTDIGGWRQNMIISVYDGTAGGGGSVVERLRLRDSGSLQLTGGRNDLPNMLSLVNGEDTLGNRTGIHFGTYAKAAIYNIVTVATSYGRGALGFAVNDAASSATASLADEKMRLTTVGLGIGTTTPSASLHISGSSGSVLLEIDSDSTQNILYISGSGNIGIGTTTPLYRLDISGSARAQTNLNVGDTAFTATTPNYISLGGTYANSGYGAKLKLLDSGATQWGVGISTAGINYYGTVHNFFQGATSTAIVLYATDDTASTNPAYIAIGQSYSSVAGANPKLRLYGTTYGFGVSAGQVDYIAPRHVFYTGNVLIGTATDSAKLVVKGSGTTSSTTALLVQNSNASSSLAVLDNGNVGIGTSTPVTKLEVYGINELLRFGDGTSGNDAYMSFNSRGYLGFAGAGGLNFIANTTRPIIFGGSGSWSSFNEWARFQTGTGNLLIGTATDAGFKLDVSGSGRFTNNLIVTGSLTVVTGSSVEFQVNQTGVKIGNATTDSHSITGSIAISSSASTSSAALLIYKSGSTVLDIQGSQGQLFSVIDILSGSLMSVNDVSGLPILEVFSDDRVVLGTYGAPALIITGSNAVFTGSVVIDGALLDTIRTGSLATGSTLIYTVNTGSYQAGFFDYYINSGSNFRAGNIMAVFGAGTYRFTDAATPDIGNTTNLQFSMSMAGASAQLYASASTAGWTVKTTFRTI